MARISILIGGHLSTAPRPLKEACALAAVGHDVVVLGVWFDDALAARDRAVLRNAPFEYVPVLDIRPSRRLGAMQRLHARVRGRLAREMFVRTGRFSPPLLGYGIARMGERAEAIGADLTIAHSEGGLWIADRLLRAGNRVGIDFEDWFSEDLLPADRVARPVNRVRALEAELARACTYVTAASGAMADGIAAAYSAPMPTVVYNAFPMHDRGQEPARVGPADRKNPDAVSLHWFSQTVGPGRGLESMFRALPHIAAPVEVHLRGSLTYERRSWLVGLIGPDETRVRVHETVAGGELPDRIAEHDIGLALEVPFCLNRDLTATNKLFQYLGAGLGVIATSTAGQREVLAREPSAGIIIPPDDPRALAAAVNRWVYDPMALANAKCAARRLATALSWADQEARIIELAERAIGAGPVRRQQASITKPAAEPSGTPRVHAA